jgi:hypothetical protein
MLVVGGLLRTSSPNGGIFGNVVRFYQYFVHKQAMYVLFGSNGTDHDKSHRTNMNCGIMEAGHYTK